MLLVPTFSPGNHTRDTSGNENLLMEAGAPFNAWHLDPREMAELTLPCPHWPVAEDLKPVRPGSARIPHCPLQQWQTGLALGSGRESR